MIAMRNKLIMPKIIINKINNAPVGKHNHISDENFLEDELLKGIEIEMEHTDDPEIAKAIAKDHLAGEFSDYYTRLIKMEEEAKAEFEDNETISDEELDNLERLMKTYV
jgi:uncharacterized protein YcbK (DUF882 family)